MSKRRTNAVLCAVFAASLPGPQTFHTAARFTVDERTLALQTAVAVAEAHAVYKEFSWVRVYFYGFPLTAEDVTSLSGGNLEGLERKRKHVATTAAQMNSSRAVLHFLLDKDGTLSNASLEVPGLTCTIVVEAKDAPGAVQTFEYDGSHLRLKAHGAKTCDLTSVNGGKHPMAWDADVTLPVFEKR
jgi:hypothetical protein